MRMWSVFLIASAAVAARAETKVAVPNMKVTGAEESLGPILTEIITTETSRLGHLTVLGSSDISSMLGFEQEKQLLGENTSGLSTCAGGPDDCGGLACALYLIFGPTSLDARPPLCVDTGMIQP